MAISITHKKIGTIPDWTQADIDIQIALGNLPAGTTPANMQLTTDWNDNHAFDATGVPDNYVVTAISGVAEWAAPGSGSSNIYNTSDVITNNDAREVGIYGTNTSLTFKAKNSSGDTDPQVFLRFTNDDPMVDLTASNSSGEYIRFYTSGANGYIQDTKSTPVGLEYVADYSATFTSRSLVDKGFVTTNYVPYTGATSDINLTGHGIDNLSFATFGTVDDLVIWNALDGNGKVGLVVLDDVNGNQANLYPSYHSDGTAAGAGDVLLTMDGVNYYAAPGGAGAVSSVTASDQTVEVSPTTGAVLITAHLPYIFNYMFMGS